MSPIEGSANAHPFALPVQEMKVRDSTLLKPVGYKAVLFPTRAGMPLPKIRHRAMFFCEQSKAVTLSKAHPHSCKALKKLGQLSESQLLHV